MSERALSAEQLVAVQEVAARNNKTAAELTANDVDRMTGDEYRNRLRSDSEFSARVDAIEAERRPRPR
jgi:hypothetical protein